MKAIDAWPSGHDSYKILIKEPRAAAKVNATLGYYYPRGTRFNGAEVIFNFKERDRHHIEAVLKCKLK